MTPHHPKDRAAVCVQCGVRALQEYLGTSVQAAGETMREAMHVRCDACRRVTLLPGAERPDLDGEAAGWVFDRRDRAQECAPDSAERPTARPPARAVA